MAIYAVFCQTYGAGKLLEELQKAWERLRLLQNAR